MTSNEWKLTALEDIAEPSSPIRYGVVQIGLDTEGGIPIVPIKFIDSISTAKLHRAAISIEEKYRNSRVQGGDVLISIKGTIGAVGVVPNGFQGNIAREIARIRPSKDYDSHFIALQLQAEKTQRRIESLTVGTTRREFSIHAIRKFEIEIPLLPEQKKIAEILSAWDDAIAANEDLLANSRLRQKALMQDLLTGKKRLPGFEGEWKLKPIGKLFSERNETGAEDMPLIGIGEVGVYLASDSGRKDNSSSDKGKYKVIYPGDIGYNTMRMWQGRCGLSSLKGIVSPAYTVITPKESSDGAFFYYLFKTPAYIHKFYSRSQGLVSDTWSLKYKEFSKIVVFCPSADEQKAISGVFQTCDEEIEALEHRINNLKLQKKALMQQLLTGKKRVQVKAA